MAPNTFSLGLLRFGRLRPRTSLGDLLGLYRQRHTLSQLDDRALDDIGISRDAAETEAARPIWDVPQHWLR